MKWVEIKMEKLKGMFWTNKNEMLEELEGMGYEVIDENDEYIVIADEHDEEIKLDLIIARNTIAIDIK